MPLPAPAPIGAGDSAFSSAGAAGEQREEAEEHDDDEGGMCFDEIMEDLLMDFPELRDEAGAGFDLLFHDSPADVHHPVGVEGEEDDHAEDPTLVGELPTHEALGLDGPIGVGGEVAEPLAHEVEPSPEVEAVAADAEAAILEDPIHPPVGEIPEVDGGALYTLSPMGYVTSHRAPHAGQILGLVGYKRDAKSIFANCHLHSKCSISSGIMRINIEREWMAEWLMRGVPPPPGASVIQKQLMGAEHRTLWARPDA